MRSSEGLETHWTCQGGFELFHLHSEELKTGRRRGRRGRRGRHCGQGIDGANNEMMEWE